MSLWLTTLLVCTGAGLAALLFTSAWFLVVGWANRLRMRSEDRDPCLLCGLRNPTADEKESRSHEPG